MPVNTNELKPGTPVKVKINGVLTSAKFIKIHDKYGLPQVQLENGQITVRKIFEIGATPVGEPSTTAAAVEVADEDHRREFPINVRFSFLEQMVKMVSTATSGPNSMVVTGDGGLGKTFTVIRCLTESSLEEDIDYVVVKGNTTPKSLYRALYENRDRIVLFDDCDSVLSNEVCVNLLKAALDTQRTRRVSWLTERASDANDGALPTSFDFVGKVIFVSNKKLSEVPQPILSRALYVDVSMTVDEKLERMTSIASQVRPDVALEHKIEVIEFMRTIKGQIRDLNVRTMLKVIDIRNASPDCWRDVSTYVLTA